MLWELWESSECASEKSPFHGNQPWEGRTPFPHPSPSEPWQTVITTF